MNTTETAIIAALLPALPTLVGTVVLALVGWLVKEAAAYVASVRANKNATSFQTEVANFIAMAVSGAAQAVPDGATAADLVLKAVHDRYPAILTVLPDSALRLMVENAVASFKFATGQFKPATQVSLNVVPLLPQSAVAAANAAGDPAKAAPTASAAPTKLTVVPSAEPEATPDTEPPHTS